jgi:hypothetical protein
VTSDESMPFDDPLATILDAIRCPANQTSPELLVPPRSSKRSRIGEAFDYALRFGLDARYPTRKRKLRAEVALDELGNVGSHQKKRARRMLDVAMDLLSSADLLAGLAHEAALASLDLVTLQGFPYTRNQENYLDRGKPSAEQIQELQDLYDVVPWPEFQPGPGEFIALNPGFRTTGGSGDPSADLLVGDTLIDIKVVRDTSLKTALVRQLVLYAALARENGTTWRPGSVHVDQLGIYYARHGYLHSFALSDCIADGQEEIVLNGIVYFGRSALGLG